MADVMEKIVVVLLLSLCFQHFHEFEAFHSKIPAINNKFANLESDSDLISLILFLFPPFPKVMDKQRWTVLHAWETDDSTDSTYGDLFKDLSLYGINCINTCETCRCFCKPDQTEATQIRNDQVFFSSLATFDRRTIVTTARNYPSDLKEYKDSSQYVGEYADMERRLNNAVNELAVCKKIIKNTML